MRCVGYRQVWQALDAGTVDAVRDPGIAATRQLAKRQLTWLRGELDARWFDPQQQRDALEEALRLFLPARLPV
jgi:tRNA dimethylallyltransferase